MDIVLKSLNLFIHLYFIEIYLFFDFIIKPVHKDKSIGKVPFIIIKTCFYFFSSFFIYKQSFLSMKFSLLNLKL